MAKALSTDLRHRVIGAIAQGMSCRQAAAHFGVSASSAIRWQAQQRALGHVTARRQGGDRRSKRIEAHADIILGEIATTPDLTLAELQAKLDALRGALRHRHHLALLQAPADHAQKKTAHAAEQQRCDVKAARQAWFEGQLDLDPTKLVFIDETGATTKMARRHGRAPRGERCRAGIPHGHWKTTTLTAGLRLNGIAAPMVIDGPMDGAAFLAYVQQVLAPELGPGEVVVMDNLPAHRVAGVRRPSRPEVRACFTCRPIRRISIRSNSPSPSSRHCFAPLPPAPSPTSGWPLRKPSNASPRRNAETTSPPQDMMHSDRKTL
jgi:transposase